MDLEILRPDKDKKLERQREKDRQTRETGRKRQMKWIGRQTDSEKEIDTIE